MSSFPYAKPWTKPDEVLAVRDQAATALLLLADIKPNSRLWGYLRFVLGTLPLRRCEGLRFAKQLGSGENGGFGLKPSLSIQGLFLAFDQREQAFEFWHTHPLVRRYQQSADECLALIATPLRARGSWSGQQPFGLTASASGLGGHGPGASAGAIGVAPQATHVAPQVIDVAPQVIDVAAQAISTEDRGLACTLAKEPIAALTRASIRISKASAFWSKAPAAQNSLAQHPGCLLAIGLGEAPLLRQATFSVWESAASMDAYARTGSHLEAIKAAGAGRYFSEDMFVRFRPLAAFGTWRGKTLNLAPASAGDLANRRQGSSPSP